MNLELSPKQYQVLKYCKKHNPIINICEGAVRSGKTVVNNILFLNHVGRNTGKMYILTGHTIPSLTRNILSGKWGLEDLLQQKITLNRNNAFELHGNTIYLFGADNNDSFKAMRGLTAIGWYANEITLQHPNTIKEAFDRCSDSGFRMWWDCNPDYPDHPIKTDFIDKSGEKLDNGQERIKSWHFELDDNAIFLPAEYIENLKKSTPHGMWYDRKIKGLWVAAEGIVYESFNKEDHVIESFKIPPHWKRIRAIDFGYTNPFACLWGALDEDGRLYIYDEYKQAQTLLKDHVGYINSKQESFKNLYGEIQNIEYQTISDHDAQDNAELRNLGLYTTNAIKDVSLGIQKVAERFVIQKDGKPRVFIFNKCKELIKEIGKYAWSEKKEGKPIKEEPVKIDDHLCDAFRYLVAEIDLRPQLKVGDIGAGYFGL